MKSLLGVFALIGVLSIFFIFFKFEYGNKFTSVWLRWKINSDHSKGLSVSSKSRTENGDQHDHNETLRGKFNVVMFMVDGFRSELGSYLDTRNEQPWLFEDIKTPNLDRLANVSVRFKRAFAQFGRCAPSRSSILVGRRIDSIHMSTMATGFREVAGENIISLPQYFRQHGYTTIGQGKVFCPSIAPFGNDKGKSWDELWTIPSEGFDASWVMADKDGNEPLWDQRLLLQVKASLTKHSAVFNSTQKPFFMFVGFKRPHFPLRVPKKFFDMYPLDKVTIANNSYVPHNMAEPSWHESPEILNYHDTIQYAKRWKVNSTLPNTLAKGIRRAYCASVSYIDDIAGEMLTHIDRLGLRENTVVIFTADHGVHLGENGLWGKQSNFEVNVRVPLLIDIPGVADPGVSNQMVEMVDIFPTVIEAAGLPKVPMCPERPDGIALCTEGVSLLPLVRKPNYGKWKDRVFWQARWQSHLTVYTGYSMRNNGFRYSEWIESTAGPPREWPKPYASELYDKIRDPGENFNLANDTSYSDVIKTLSKQLHAGWRAART
ncbi:hypothetical protein CAPTEDRAFT_194100 [Capitella teleta]|uniref:Sulfatase N-terminal domain-containing protein n=1 Tax=Capitella teleta TaxID=283909 RepID=R7UAS8_CAPTE|nr:hypothetical protein CAPTEDRAFT_194100 [Capitella teleta]|eukprot:ELU00908.1 hypothetical protein CAPTEDRAFT_194100 [Capitella teleta]